MQQENSNLPDKLPCKTAGNEHLSMIGQHNFYYQLNVLEYFIRLVEIEKERDESKQKMSDLETEVSAATENLKKVQQVEFLYACLTNGIASVSVCLSVNNWL